MDSSGNNNRKWVTDDFDSMIKITIFNSFGFFFFEFLIPYVVSQELRATGIVWDLFSPKSPFIVSIVIKLAFITFFIFAIFYLKPHLAESIKVKYDGKKNS
ncbi:MAG: hypothetical protein ACFFFH_19450 [Candidatus Thorarchaeota archaeon]